ncbi:MAG: CoA transferase, partial [Deltaproteobacteria bacterium]|nr:CoA transferase [Deltaproteobacteria bacterium]
MTLLPLSGIRVLDLGHLLPGPLTAVLLADLGAEVIKIEKPPRGDANRYIPPLQHGISPYFLMLNRNKKSIFLDLKQPKDHRKFLKLVQKSDVLIENFRPGVMKKLALDHEALSKINPKLIYCSISGYGQKGPWKGHAGHDLNYVALSGLLYATAFRGERPVQFATQLGDIVGGSLMPALSILAALLLREKTNQGCWIDSAMMPATMMLWILVLGKILQTGQEAK